MLAGGEAETVAGRGQSEPSENNIQCPPPGCIDRLDLYSRVSWEMETFSTNGSEYLALESTRVTYAIYIKFICTDAKLYLLQIHPK